MNDLVKRLRSYGGDDIRKESADHIEALEAALRDIIAEVGTSTRANKIAQFALNDGTGQDK